MTEPAPNPAFAAGLRAYLADLVVSVGAAPLARAVLVLLCATVAESLGLLLLVPLLQIVDGQSRSAALTWLLRQGLQPSLATVLALFVALMLLRSWLARRRDLDLLALRLRYVDTLRTRLETALALASWQFLVRLRHAEVMHLMFDQLGRVSLGTHQLMQLLAGLGLGLASLIVLIVIAPAWTLALMLPFAVLAWVLRRRLAQAAAMGSRFGLGQREIMTAARDFLAGLKLVKAHAVEERHLAELARRAATLNDELLQFARHQSSTRAWFELGGGLLLAALLYGAAIWGKMALPELLLMVLVFSRLLPVLRDSQLQLQQISHNLPAYHELHDWIVRCRAAVESRALQPAERLALRQSLRLDGVGLRYAKGATPALSGISLVLEAGSTTALTGASGSGKTSLADVAMGLLAPSAGSVSVDGQRLSDGATLQRWRGSVAYVAQDTYLFPGNIRDNLCWLSGRRDDDQIWAALDQADASAFVQALPAGLDHRLGERGEGLSGGQRQRLALARALLCQPELLVLDEVTSQLDPDSEARVLEALARLRGKTTILSIAHRPAAKGLADRVVVLEAGRILHDSGGDANH